MLTAITRAPGSELPRCQLTHLQRQPLDWALAQRQHRAYQEALRRAGVEVVELPADPALPDGVFVEDTAVVLDEVAVLASLTPASRRAEPAAVEAALVPHRTLARLPAEARLEGGDVLRVGRTLFTGLSTRTDEAGLRALASAVRPFGYVVVAVPVQGCLHLKTACCALDERTLLVHRPWLDTAALAGFRLVDVPAEEPWAANVLVLPGRVLVSASHPRTIGLIESMGYPAFAVDVSELHKAEAGLTCMSLVFPTAAREPASGGLTSPG
jgi:dimethylargininase